MKDPVSTEARTGIGSESRLHCDENSSAEDLEKCTEATRQNVSRTMQQVEDRLAPGRLYDDAWHFVRQALSDARNRSYSLDEAVRNNPAAFAVMGIGLALLGGSIAGYAFKKMSESDLSQSGRQLRRDVAEPDDIPRSEWDPGAVTPPVPTEQSPVMGLEHEASTEDVQKDIQASSAGWRSASPFEEEEDFADTEDQEEFATRKPRHS